jgi:hypothetical protein
MSDNRHSVKPTCLGAKLPHVRAISTGRRELGALALCAVGVCAGGRRRGDPRTGVGMGRAALGLSSAVCVGWRLIELPGLLLLVVEGGLGPERDAAWRGFERGRTGG